MNQRKMIERNIVSAKVKDRLRKASRLRKRKQIKLIHHININKINPQKLSNKQSKESQVLLNGKESGPVGNLLLKKVSQVKITLSPASKRFIQININKSKSGQSLCKKRKVKNIEPLKSQREKEIVIKTQITVLLRSLSQALFTSMQPERKKFEDNAHKVL